MNRSTVLKSSDQISDVFNTGIRYSSGLVRILIKKHEEQRGPCGRVAFIAGKKLGNAVVRNKSKRLLRAAAQYCDMPVDGYDVVLMATSKTKSASSLEIAESLGYLLRKAGLRCA